MTSSPHTARPSFVVVGTHNAKKAAELHRLLEPHRIDVRSLRDYPRALEVDETGDTFAANAALKASHQAQHLGCWVIGEDSGLCVDALGGAPGIHSARFAGVPSSDPRNNQRLLDELQGLPDAQRSAHYVCHLSLSDPNGRIRLDCEATCRGRIRTEPAGNHGFGYDPLFEIVELHRTFGQLGPAVKAILSHRARAMRRFVPALIDLLDEKSGCA